MKPTSESAIEKHVNVWEMSMNHSAISYISNRTKVNPLMTIQITGSSRLMRISLLRIWLLRFFKAITKNLPNAIFMYYYFS